MMEFLAQLDLSLTIGAMNCALEQPPTRMCDSSPQDVRDAMPDDANLSIETARSARTRGLPTLTVARTFCLFYGLAKISKLRPLATR
jgi:hypothetical protein